MHDGNLDVVIRGLTACMGDMSGTRECPPDCPYHQVDEDDGFCDAQLMRDARALIEAQRPVKPFIEEDVTLWWYACGYCEGKLDEGDKFCRKCGRGVAWT